MIEIHQHIVIYTDKTVSRKFILIPFEQSAYPFGFFANAVNCANGATARDMGNNISYFSKNIYNISTLHDKYLCKFVYMDIVENILKIRKEKGITQEVVASALNVDTSVVSNIENKKRELRISELEKIANALAVDVLYLLTYPYIFVRKEPQPHSEQPETILQIKISGNKREKILAEIFGNKDLDFLNG